MLTVLPAMYWAVNLTWEISTLNGLSQKHSFEHGTLYVKNLTQRSLLLVAKHENKKFFTSKRS